MTTEVKTRALVGHVVWQVLVDGIIECEGSIDGVHQGAVDEAQGLSGVVARAVAEFYEGTVQPAIEPTEPKPDPEGPTVLLVACSAGKAPGPRHAINLYDGPLYRLRVEWCRAVHGRDPDGILSAKHYLVDPTQVLERYDLKLTDLDRDERSRWNRQVEAELLRRCPRGTRLVVLAGADYVKGWVTELRRAGREVERRNFGGVGYERAALKQEIDEAKAKGRAQQLGLGVAEGSDG